ncbi:threo-3-hydroxy-L-aspartate ammonia-lyase [Acinetobacter calcoaceticus]|uniref:threo-3-hydroxy-L-aspartate ammonia-lyase n=1 Tax=Acinetobacter calcoaceticus TaxID=471 RepID=UPI001901A7B2|nr:threo-3-hydroxy-L-aspartate ammonia-lyase [Acinetobacter calcoaceticus]MBJ9720668.1 threo-3-hydroxy-L-aspartate ammonia-lyase [Acinetobacter calcoaceticus]
MKNLTLPTYEDVAAAAERIKEFVNKTPVLTSRTVNNEFGAEVFFKCENFQRVGAFKFRGAMNALLQFSEAQKKAGVVTFSSGNHAQSIALSSKILGIPAIIVMPQDAPAAKMAATREYGAAIVEYDRYTESREQIGKEIAEKNGLTLIPSYDHPHVIAGQGTVAKELFEEVGELDYLFVCLGGGGLLAGSALSARQLSPNCKIYGVEPALGNDGQMSFRKGEIVQIDIPKTIADGAQLQSVGKLTFPIIQKNVDDILTVEDEELISCMKFFAERMKMVVEPTGCLGFAAARNLKHELKGKRIGIIISGGNVDISKYVEFLSA